MHGSTMPRIESRGVAHRSRIRFQTLLPLIVLAGVLPATATALALLGVSQGPLGLRVALGSLLVLIAIGTAVAVRRRVVFPLQTLANLLEALREGDYSLRGRRAQRGDVLGEVMLEVNALGATLRNQRLVAVEANALLEKILGALDAAVFAFDREPRLRLVNRAGAQLLAQPSERLLGATAAALGLEQFLAQPEAARTVTHAFAARTGRWEISTRVFREAGLSHQLLVITDLSRALREEERRAWHRLIRVVGHEINNSLAPIKSLAGTLREVVTADTRTDAEEQREVAAGLALIADRADTLGRFVAAYSQLARMPAPARRPTNLAALLARVTVLDYATHVACDVPADLTLDADPAQLEQLLINLVKNAAEAAVTTAGLVRVNAYRNGAYVNVDVIDDGPGVVTDNLFVPFFTTKPGGTGIGLVLSRQIAEAHGGSLEVRNRTDGRGCIAQVTLPAPS